MALISVSRSGTYKVVLRLVSCRYHSRNLIVGDGVAYPHFLELQLVPPLFRHAAENNIIDFPSTDMNIQLSIRLIFVRNAARLPHSRPHPVCHCSQWPGANERTNQQTNATDRNTSWQR